MSSTTSDPRKPGTGLRAHPPDDLHARRHSPGSSRTKPTRAPATILAPTDQGGVALNWMVFGNMLSACVYVLGTRVALCRHNYAVGLHWS